MKLQDLPKTAAETTVNLVKLPVGLVNKAREAVEERLGGGNGADASAPAVEPTKVKAAKPKAAPKKKAPAKKPGAAKAKKPAAKPKASKPSAKAKPSAASTPTPADKPSAAERPGVIAEQTDGLDEAVDRAQFELHKRDIDVNSGEPR